VTGRNETAERFLRRTGLTAVDQERLLCLPLFEGLTVPALQDLLADAWVQSFARNANLFLQGDPAVRFYVVLDGWVKLFRSTEQGDETVLGVFAAGESFAEAALFDSAVYPVGAAVVEDSRLLVVSADPFVQRLAANGDYALKMMAAMSRHMRRLVQQVERITLKSSTERVAEFLVKLCPQRTGAAVIRLPMDKALIAGRLGMQPETLSRSLAKLRSLGVVSNGPQVSIADVAALREMSGGRGGGLGCAPQSAGASRRAR
jgi:CRP-like cAMP-binding protein